MTLVGGRPGALTQRALDRIPAMRSKDLIQVVKLAVDERHPPRCSPDAKACPACLDPIQYLCVSGQGRFLAMKEVFLDERHWRDFEVELEVDGERFKSHGHHGSERRRFGVEVSPLLLVPQNGNVALRDTVGCGELSCRGGGTANEAHLVFAELRPPETLEVAALGRREGSGGRPCPAPGGDTDTHGDGDGKGAAPQSSEQSDGGAAPAEDVDPAEETDRCGHREGKGEVEPDTRPGRPGPGPKRQRRGPSRPSVSACTERGFLDRKGRRARGPT